MSTPSSPKSDLHQEVANQLSENDVRYTTARRAVVTTLHMARGPQSAAELNGRLDQVPLSSLYRSLTVLADNGVLSKHHDAGGLARFELAEWLTGHHHHIICLDCGIVEDVTLDGAAETVVNDLAISVADQAGFQLGGHVLEVEGLCETCRV